MPGTPPRPRRSPRFSAATADGPPAQRILVAVSSSERSVRLIERARRLSEAWSAPWEAIYIKTPEALDRPQEGEAAARHLGAAAQAGAAIATIPAATVADGIAAHLVNSPASLLVLGQSRKRRRPWNSSVAEQMLRLRPDLDLFLCPPREDEAAQARPFTISRESRPDHYGIALLAVAATLLLATALQRTTGVQALVLLLLFPIVAVAARLGLKPAILAALLAVLGYNFLLLQPAFTFTPLAPENLIVTGVLLAISVYVSLLTSALRGRLALADRSARENSSLAAFSLRLTRLAEWEETAQAVCEQVSAMIGVQAIVLREVRGNLEAAAAVPADAALSPLDFAALEYAWRNVEPSGSGTSCLSMGEWQFHPLATSLGTLAMLAVAREDGSDPVRADQAVLLSTLVAQAALAHERLRLEDMMRERGLDRREP
ncbi:MAG: DUF4118 domain-containing protein [Allosphingosinicella sp.]